MQLGEGAVPALTVLFKRLRLHDLTAMAAHHQEEVIVTGVEAKDGHVCRESTDARASEVAHEKETSTSTVCRQCSGAEIVVSGRSRPGMLISEAVKMGPQGMLASCVITSPVGLKQNLLYRNNLF